MQVNSRGRLAVDALVDLALCDRARPVSLPQISQRISVSLSYLEQIFKKLREKGIVDSVRGGNGGYTFARPLEQVTVADILLAVGDTGGVRINDAGSAPDNNAGRVTPALWNGVNTVMMNYFVSVSLRDLVDGATRKQSDPVI